MDRKRHGRERERDGIGPRAGTQTRDAGSTTVCLSHLKENWKSREMGLGMQMENDALALKLSMVKNKYTSPWFDGSFF